jgi:hypothetical protein
MHVTICCLFCVFNSFLSTSGQNIHDIFKFVHSDDHLDIMESTLKWRHIAPTAPDTLGMIICIDVKRDLLLIVGSMLSISRQRSVYFEGIAARLHCGQFTQI